ncbi:MAG TPA: ABC transporter ATP-binding protein [Burkholderiales bacterium]|nr:ABC transporter ATP-binding protein [Burkholderiales bacterium]
MNDDAILVAERLTKKFGEFVANKDISVRVRRGKLTSIIGPNGAGKSTFFNMVSGALVPSSGRLLFEGRDLNGLPRHRFARLGIAKSFQITNVFPLLSVLENVRSAVQAQHTQFNLWTPRARMTEYVRVAEALLERVELIDKRHLRAHQLAHGEQRSLEVALALASDPKLLLMDEPTAGMSPEETVAMMHLITQLARERTVVLVEHKMKLVMGISDRIIVLHHGELLAEGAPDDIRANEEVKRVYLGSSGQ